MSDKLRDVDVFLAQLPTLLGVIFGALATVTATSVSDRVRWYRTQSVRWDEHRLKAYMDYARAIKEMHSLAFRLTAARRPGSVTPVIDRDHGLQLLSEAMANRAIVWEVVLLLGDKETVRAARAWSDAVLRLVKIARDLSEYDGWVSAVRTVDQARDEFYTVARASLTVPGGGVAQARQLAQRLTE